MVKREKKIVEVLVPCGVTNELYSGVPAVTVISRFSLKPKINGNWVTKIVNNEEEPLELDGFKISFSSPNKKLKELEEIQRAILIVSLDEASTNENVKGFWKFVSDGVVIPDISCGKPFSLSSKVLDGGKKLYVLIDKVGSTGSSHEHVKFKEVSFLFIASYTEHETGKETVYLSQDPSIGIGRTIGN